MKVRLRDFAEINRISIRTAQIHIKENWESLDGHIERRGKQGTWIDDFAQEFLLEVIQLPGKDEVVVPSAREGALLIQLAEANRARAEAEHRASMFAEAAGKTALLEAANDAQAAQIAELATEKGRVEQELAQEKQAREKKDAEIKESQQREEEQRKRAEAAEAKLAKLEAMPKWKKALIGWKVPENRG